MPHPLKILLLDHHDEAAVIKTLLSTVKEFDFDVDTTASLEQAYLNLRAQTYDALMTNVNLPEARGAAIVQGLRNVAPAVPILLLSSAADRELVPEAVTAGADNHVIRDAADGNRLALGILYARQRRTKTADSVPDFEPTLRKLEGKFTADIESNKVSVTAALNEFVKAVENYQNNSYRASVLLLLDGKLHLGAAPNLPDVYNRAIDGMFIGNGAGSCGTAAYFRQTIYVTDIETDPLWVDFKAKARPHNLKACWSVPIIDSDDKLHGTFALYHDKTRFPSAEERDFIHAAAKTAGKILQQHNWLAVK